MPGLPSGRRAKWAVVLVWIALVAVAVPFAGKLPDVVQSECASELPRGAQSTRAEELAPRFGGEPAPRLRPRGRDLGGLAGEVVAVGQRDDQEQRRTVRGGRGGRGGRDLGGRKWSMGPPVGLGLRAVGGGQPATRRTTARHPACGSS